MKQAPVKTKHNNSVYLVSLLQGQVLFAQTVALVVTLIVANLEVKR